MTRTQGKANDLRLNDYMTVSVGRLRNGCLVTRQGWRTHAVSWIQSFAIQVDTDFKSATGFARHITKLGGDIGHPTLELHTRRFLYRQLHPELEEPVNDAELPEIDGRISVFKSATSIFYAPSNSSSTEGMYREVIRSTAMWKMGEIHSERRDCALVEDLTRPNPINGLHVARILLFFSFKHDNITYPCALVHWYKRTGTGVDDTTGMWAVVPRPDEITVIHISHVLRGAHLLPVFADDTFIPHDLNYTQTLDAFISFYINRFVDYHAHEILSP